MPPLKFEHRQKGDYDVQYTPNTETVKNLFIKAKDFIDTIMKIF
jgi:uncharacterized protein (UPF0332 family)